jgi:hypothetical protein
MVKSENLLATKAALGYAALRNFSVRLTLMRFSLAGRGARVPLLLRAEAPFGGR